jgi:transposase
MSMTMAQARTLGRKLRLDGMNLEAISQKLAEGGYLSRKTGKALSDSAVCKMLQPQRRRRAPSAERATKGAPQKVSGAKASQKLQLVRLLCSQTGMSAEDRIAAIQLLTEA